MTTSRIRCSSNPLASLFCPEPYPIAAAAEASGIAPPLPPRPKIPFSAPISDVSPSSSTKRHCRMTAIYFLDYYFDLISYVQAREIRTSELDSNLSQSELLAFRKAETAKLRERRTRMSLASFQILLQIGQGGYGQVFLARKRRESLLAETQTPEVMALKKMSKRALHRMGEIQHVLTERDILSRASTEWLVKLYYAFQDTESVYLAMEYVPGGDVRTLLNNSGVLREEHSRFYIAEMAVAVAELHRLGFIHRDLKPENYLIDSTGHLKLTDFGLCRGSIQDEFLVRLRSKLEKVGKAPFVYKSVKDRGNLYKSVKRNEDMRCYSQVGSPDYMAPEILRKSPSGYSLSVDYWSLGCILYECLCGFPPFTGQSSDEIWTNVWNWKKVLERPVYTGEDEEFNLSDVSWDLVTRLITTPKDRIASLSQLQDHQFFMNCSFMLLRTDKIKPPFVPQLSSPTDTSYFDDFTNPKDLEMYKEVKERQAKLDGKLAEQSAPSKKSWLFSRLGAHDHKREGLNSKEVDDLRSAFVGFTFKVKD